MKMFKSIISMILVFSMLVTLVACGGNDNVSTDANTPQANEPELSGDITKTVIPWYRSEMTTYTSKDTGMVKKTPKDTVVYATSGQIIGCDPLNSQEEYCWSHNVYETLITRDWETGEFKGSLATEWNYDEEGNLHITLREGVKFHDGTLLDAEDVLFTLKRNADSPRSKVRDACSKINYEKSYIEDPLKLVLVFNEPSGSILYAMASGWLGIMSKEFVEEKGSDYDFMEADAGTGAYQVVETVTGISQTFERFPDYWGGTPDVKTIVYKLFKDYTTMLIDYQNGDLDFCLNNNYDSFTRFFNGEISDTICYQIPVNRGQVLQLTTVAGTPLDDVRIRQALAYSIDYDGLLLGVYQGEEMAKLPSSIFITGVKHGIDLGTYEYNPEKAIGILADAGYSKENPLKITLETSDNVNNIAAAEMVQYYAGEIGIDIEVISEKSVAMTAAMNSTSYEYDIILMPITYGSGYPDETLAGRNAYGAEEGTFSYNRGIDDPEVCALMTEAFSCTDEVRAAELYSEIQEMFYDQCWVIPLSVGSSIVFCRNYLQNTQIISGYGTHWADWTIVE